MLYFQQKLCFLDLIKFDFLLAVICLFDQSLGLYNGIIGDQTLTFRRSLIICRSQGKDPDADNWPFSLQKEAWGWTACDEISVLTTMIVLVAPMVIFLDKRGLNAFLKPFMLVFNERGTFARPPRLLRVHTRSSTTKRWHRPNVIKSFLIDASLSIFHLMPDQIPTNIRAWGEN